MECFFVYSLKSYTVACFICRLLFSRLGQPVTRESLIPVDHTRILHNVYSVQFKRIITIPPLTSHVNF